MRIWRTFTCTAKEVGFGLNVLALTGVLLIGLAKDVQSALKLYQEAANLGSAHAMCYLGNFYRTGKGVERDEQQAHQWYERAAALMEPTAIFILAQEAQDSGDMERYASLLQKAADLDEWHACVELAIHLNSGTLPGIAADPARVFTYMKKAVEQECDDEAHYFMGCCYSESIGVAQDKTEAAKWWTRAAAAGNVRAMVALGQASQEKADSKQAREWFEKAFNCDSNCETQACVLLGNMLVAGSESDAMQGIKVLQTGAEKGNEEALLTLGECYMEGKGVCLPS